MDTSGAIKGTNANIPAAKGNENEKERLRKEIEDFKKNGPSIIERAYNEGGETRVLDIEKAQQEKEAKYFKLVAGELNKNEPKYEELTKKSLNESRAIQETKREMQEKLREKGLHKCFRNKDL